MNYKKLIVTMLLLTISFVLKNSTAVRLTNIFNFLNTTSDISLKGFLHIGKAYVVFLRVPNPEDKYLTYELYESKNLNTANEKPQLIAVSEIPVTYIKEQLKIYKDELFKAKYVDDSVPGTRVRTLREWQIENALKSRKSLAYDHNTVLRS